MAFKTTPTVEWEVWVALRDLISLTERDDGRKAFEVHHRFQQSMSRWYFHMHGGKNTVHTSVDNLVAVPPHIHDEITAAQRDFWKPYMEEFDVTNHEALQDKLLDPRNKRRSRQIYRAYLTHIDEMDQLYSRYFITRNLKTIDEVLDVMKRVANSDDFDPAKTRAWKVTINNQLKSSKGKLRPLVLLAALGITIDALVVGRAWIDDGYTGHERADLAEWTTRALEEQVRSGSVRGETARNIANALVSILEKLNIDPQVRQGVLRELLLRAAPLR